MKHLRDKDGRFAGSVGAGKEPPAAPGVPPSSAATSEDHPRVSADQVYEAYAILSGQRPEEEPPVLACGCLEGTCPSDTGGPCRYEDQMEAEFARIADHDAVVNDPSSVQYVDEMGVRWAIRENPTAGTVDYAAVDHSRQLYSIDGTVDDAMRFIDVDQPVVPLARPPF